MSYWVAGARLPVLSLIAFKRRGWSDSKIVSAYPGLLRDDHHLSDVWSWVAAHAAELEQEAEQNERLSFELAMESGEGTHKYAAVARTHEHRGLLIECIRLRAELAEAVGALQIIAYERCDCPNPSGCGSEYRSMHYLSWCPSCIASTVMTRRTERRQPGADSEPAPSWLCPHCGTLSEPVRWQCPTCDEPWGRDDDELPRGGEHV